ncbi:uncharacterized protein BYT42DRAFT_544717 [Radiomyces spectabilis]|uniref:uncharacterized protein n=1 Tax=Radiomyces spectabilis TaxID=64574 RepID=UPI00221F8DC2|nr:uncharacterized protein BYT42DRAFT_544717 [Radiomyces spectabilis]KAI8384894.1 hypothetical protein BYT42DRAFT_544717 [Radiomyces spectabilis]
MGLLKFGSLYKSRNRRDKSQPTTASSPDVNSSSTDASPPSLPKLDLSKSPLSHSSSDQPSSDQPSTPVDTWKPANRNKDSNSNTLLDDIFLELNKPHDQELHNDLLLANALSEQLALSKENQPRHASPPTPTSGSKMESKTMDSAFLATDNIYSSYLRALQSQEEPAATDTSSTSMFAHLLSGNNSSTSAQSQSQTPLSITSPLPNTNNTKAEKPKPATQIVLDSDVSDSDDAESDHSSDDEDPGKARRTAGVLPIMERRPVNHRLALHRKIDAWANRVDPKANQIESNEAMIARMQERHRHQYKLMQQRQQGTLPRPIDPYSSRPMPSVVPMMTPVSPQLFSPPPPPPPHAMDMSPMMMTPIHAMDPRMSLPVSPLVSPPPIPSSIVPTPFPRPASLSSQRRRRRSPTSSSDVHPASSVSASSSTCSSVPAMTARNSTAPSSVYPEADGEDDADDERQTSSSSEEEMTKTEAKRQSMLRHCRSVPNFSKKNKKSFTHSSNNSISDSHERSDTDTHPPPPPPPPPRRLRESSSSRTTSKKYPHAVDSPPFVKHRKSEPEMSKHGGQVHHSQPRRPPFPSYPVSQASPEQMQLEWHRLQLLQREQQLQQQLQQHCMQQYHNLYRSQSVSRTNSMMFPPIPAPLTISLPHSQRPSSHCVYGYPAVSYMAQ